MRLWLLLFLGHSAISGLCQVTNNRWDRLTKDEFKQLKQQRDKFIPADIKKNKVVVIKYNQRRIAELKRMATIKSFLNNGIDTTTIIHDSILYNWNKQEIEKYKKELEKSSTKLAESLKRKLKAKGISSVICDEDSINNLSLNECRYSLNLLFITDRKSMSREFGWVMFYTCYFYDRIDGSAFEVFLPFNYSLFDLMK